MKKRKNRFFPILWGLAAGAANGLFGAGGGMVLAPGLRGTTDIEEGSLFPTTLAIMLPVCLVSVTVYGLRGDLPWASSWPWLVGSCLGGVLAGLVGKRIPALWLHRALGAVLLLGALRGLLL